MNGASPHLANVPSQCLTSKIEALIINDYVISCNVKPFFEFWRSGTDRESGFGLQLPLPPIPHNDITNTFSYAPKVIKVIMIVSSIVFHTTDGLVLDELPSTDDTVQLKSDFESVSVLMASTNSDDALPNKELCTQFSTLLPPLFNLGLMHLAKYYVRRFCTANQNHTIICRVAPHLKATSTTEPKILNYTNDAELVEFKEFWEKQTDEALEAIWTDGKKLTSFLETVPSGTSQLEDVTVEFPSTFGADGTYNFRVLAPVSGAKKIHKLNFI